jgi:hypothetical protein
MNSKTYELHTGDGDLLQGAPVVWRGEGIVIVDVVDKLKPPPAWERRGLEKIQGLFVHHKAGWGSHKATNNYAISKEGRRLSYQLGVHHRPPRMGGDLVVHLLNPLDAITPASGNQGPDSAWLDRFPAIDQSINEHTVALVFTGNMASASGNPVDLKAAMGVWRPSASQIRATWGVIRFLESGRFPSFSRERVFGHRDSGKYLCPGDDAMAFIEAVRTGQLRDAADVEGWIRDNNIPGEGWPASEAAAPAPGQGAAQPATSTARRVFTALGLAVLAGVGVALGLRGASAPGVEGADWPTGPATKTSSTGI